MYLSLFLAVWKCPQNNPLQSRWSRCYPPRPPSRNHHILVPTPTRNHQRISAVTISISSYKAHHGSSPTACTALAPWSVLRVHTMTISRHLQEGIRRLYGAVRRTFRMFPARRSSSVPRSSQSPCADSSTSATMFARGMPMSGSSRTWRTAFQASAQSRRLMM